MEVSFGCNFLGEWSYVNATQRSIYDFASLGIPNNKNEENASPKYVHNVQSALSATCLTMIPQRGPWMASQE